MIPRLYAIADAQVLAGRGVSLEDFARELRAAGVGLVQYRDKKGTPQEVLRAAGVLRGVFLEGDKPHDSDDDAVAIMGHPMLIMNDRADLAVLAGFDGVHVGQGDLDPGDARRVMAGRKEATHPFSEGEKGWATRIRGRAVIGVSTHTEEQVRVADPTSQMRDVGHPDGGHDYIAIGPVFATRTKADTEPVVGLDGVRRARALTAKPLVAIGGITRANARSVIDAGADSVAVISGLFGEGESVEKVARDFLELLR
jgi:thiamine-phosphate pyrophosphorylase